MGSPKKQRSAAQIAAQNANLVRYPKGTSGNPNGRPKGILTIAKEAADRCQPLLFLSDVVLGKYPAQMRDRITAAHTVAAYAYGKPVDQILQLSIDGRGIDTNAQLGGALEALARALSGGSEPAREPPQIVEGSLVVPENELHEPVSAADPLATNPATNDTDSTDNSAE